MSGSRRPDAFSGGSLRICAFVLALGFVRTARAGDPEPTDDFALIDAEAIASWELIPRAEREKIAGIGECLDPLLSPFRDVVDRGAIRRYREIAPVSSSVILRAALDVPDAHVRVALVAMGAGTSDRDGFAWIAAIRTASAGRLAADLGTRSGSSGESGDAGIRQLRDPGSGAPIAEFFASRTGAIWVASDLGYLRTVLQRANARPPARPGAANPTADWLRSMLRVEPVYRITVSCGALWRAMRQSATRPPAVERLLRAAELLRIEGFGGAIEGDGGGVRFVTHLLMEDAGDSLWGAFEESTSWDPLLRLHGGVGAAMDLRVRPETLLAAVVRQAPWLGLSHRDESAVEALLRSAGPLGATLTGNTRIVWCREAGDATPGGRSPAWLFESRDAVATRSALLRLADDRGCEIRAGWQRTGEIFELRSRDVVCFVGLIGDTLVVSTDRASTESFLALRPLGERPLGQDPHWKVGPIGEERRTIVRAVHQAHFGPTELWSRLMRIVGTAVPMFLVWDSPRDGPDAASRARPQPPLYCTEVARHPRGVTIVSARPPPRADADPVAERLWVERMRQGAELQSSSDLRGAAQEFRGALEVASTAPLRPCEVLGAAFELLRLRDDDDWRLDLVPLLARCVDTIEADRRTTPSQLVSLLLAQGAICGEEAPLNRALDACVRHLGRTRAYSIQAALRYGEVLLRRGEYRKAATLFETTAAAIAGCESMPEAARADVLESLAASRFARGEYETALERQREVVTLLERSGVAQDRRLLTARRNLGRILTRKGDIHAAVRLLEVARNAAGVMGKSAAGDELSCLVALAEAWLRGGDSARAEQVLRGAVGSADNPDDSSLERTRCDARELLAGILASGDRHREAETLLRECIDARARTTHPDHPDVLRGKLRMALLRLARERTPAHAAAARDALREWASWVGGQHPLVEESLALLAAAGGPRPEQGDSPRFEEELRLLAGR